MLAAPKPLEGACAFHFSVISSCHFGLLLDDYQQRIALLAGGGESANVLEFFHRGMPSGEAQMQSGVLPWWTHPDTKVVFFRPILQLLMQVD